MSIEATQRTESDYLGCCLLDGSVIDRGLQQGITPGHFSHLHHKAQFSFLCDLRLAGKDTTPEGVFAAASRDAGRLSAMGGMGAIVAHQTATTLHAPSLISSLIEIHGKREGWRILSKGLESLKSGAGDLAGLAALADELKEVSTCQQSLQRSLSDIGDDAIKDAQEQIDGKQATRTLITTGLSMFDRYATPIESHEYVVVGARTSHGKSSFLLQVAGHNLAAGRKVAIFSLETSDKAVLKQIVGQRAGVNIRQFHQETRDKQQEYMDKLRFAKTTKNLIIFDRDLTLTAIEARCRLLATSFKPDLVIIDYLGLIGIDGTSSYERMSKVSKAMIPLRKALGCALMVGAQLNRGPEKEEREPGRSDFRDAGGIEEDSHRIIALWRKPNQPLDRDYYDSALLQLKCRDGGLAKVDCSFHGPTTKFLEQVNP
jgi:replicative DNA helicase